MLALLVAVLFIRAAGCREPLPLNEHSHARAAEKALVNAHGLLLQGLQH